MNANSPGEKFPFEELIIRFVGIIIPLAPLIVLAAAFIINGIEPISGKALNQVILGSLFFIALQVAIALELRVRKIDKSVATTSGRIDDLDSRARIIERFASDTSRRMESPICAGYVNNLECVDAWYDYVADATRNATASIKDASLTSRHWPTKSDAAKRYQVERKAAICNKKIEYKYLTVFQESEDVSRLDDILAWAEMSDWDHNYGAKYIPLHDLSQALMFSFVIIDDQEVIIAFYNNESGPSEQSVSIKNNKEAIGLFSRYFEYLFSNAVAINSPKGVNVDIVNKIRNRLTEGTDQTNRT